MAVPSKDFFAAFGAIAFYYASAEFGIKATLGGILGIHTLDALILTEPHSALALRNVAKCIAKESFLPTKDKKAFIQIVGDFGAFGPLRNTVAHSQWRKGTRPGSLKPMGVDIRSGTPVVNGFGDDDPDWLAAELEAKAHELRKINIRVIEFQQRTGLDVAIAAKDAETKARIEAALGNSTNASE